MLIALLALLIVGGASAAPLAAANDPQQVFLTQSNQLTFVDLLNGGLTRIAVSGDHFTVLHDRVIYYDRAHRSMQVATPDGRLTPHPFIQPGDGVTRIDWHVAPDEQTIAWTETSGNPSALTTVTWVAGIDGEDARQVFSDGPRDGIRAYPVAFNDDKSTLYMDYQPDTHRRLDALSPIRGLVRARPAQRRDPVAPRRAGLLLRRGHRRQYAGSADRRRPGASTCASAA